MKVYKTTKGYFYKEYKTGKKVRISKENYLKLKKTKQSNRKIIKKQKGGTNLITCTLIRHEVSGSNAYTTIDKQLPSNKRNLSNRIATAMIGLSPQLNYVIKDPSLSHLGICHGIHLHYQYYVKESYDYVICSNMLRAIQTAIILFPDSVIYIVPFINEVSRAGMERMATGAFRTPRVKEELEPHLIETERIFKHAQRDELFSIFENDTYTVDILMTHFRNQDGRNKRNFQIKWEIYDSPSFVSENFLNRMQFMPEMEMFPEILKKLTLLPKSSTNSSSKVACITHGYTMVSQTNPIGFLYWMRNREANGGLYSDDTNGGDFETHIFKGKSYQFPNGSSIEFQYNTTTKKCSNLKAKYPGTLGSSFPLEYKGGIMLEFNKHCSRNNSQRISIENYYRQISENFTRNIIKQRAVLREIGFCKIFLSKDQLRYWETKFEHFNRERYKTEYSIYSLLFEGIDMYLRLQENYALNTHLKSDGFELKINYLDSLKYFREFIKNDSNFNPTLQYFNFYVILALMNELNFIERQNPKFNLSNEFLLYLLKETPLLNYLKDKNASFFINTFLKKSFCSNCFKIFENILYNKGVMVSECCEIPKIIDVNQVKRIFIKKINSNEFNFLAIEGIDWRDCILYTVFRDDMKNNKFVEIAKEIKKDDTQIQNATTKTEILNKITLKNENIRRINNLNTNSFQNVN